jgi:hypothetical protein
MNEETAKEVQAARELIGKIDNGRTFIWGFLVCLIPAFLGLINDSFIMGGSASASLLLSFTIITYIRRAYLLSRAAVIISLAVLDEQKGKPDDVKKNTAPAGNIQQGRFVIKT